MFCIAVFFFAFSVSSAFLFSFFYLFFFYLSSTSLLLYFSLTAEGRVRCVNNLWREEKNKRSKSLFNF